MHHTVTERGITNKNLLLGLSTGQILALDTRVIDPRRPLGTPSPMEKEEVVVRSCNIISQYLGADAIYAIPHVDTITNAHC